MLALAADENFNARIIRGLKRRLPDVDILTVQHEGLCRELDPTILEWAASEGRPLLTHDVSTVIKYANDRLRDELLMPGVIAVHLEAPIGRVIEDLVLVVEVGDPEELAGQILYLPL